MSASQLTDQTNFHDLYFTSTWEMAPDGSRPQLQDPREITVTDIEVTRMPPKTVYNLGEDLIAMGQISVTCSNGGTGTAAIKAEMLSGYDMNTAGEQDVIIDYKGGKGSFKITVIDPDNPPPDDPTPDDPPAHIHNYDNGTVTKEPTCTEDGEMTYKCDGCDDTYTEPIEKTGHSYVDTVVPPTCQSQGYTEHKCSKCNDTYRDSYVPMLQHQCTEEVIAPAGCMSDGLAKGTCELCGDTYTRVIPKTGHDYNVTVVAPTCNAQGYTKHVCKNCGYTYLDTYTAKTQHEFDDGVVVQEPTYNSTGLMLYTCQHCGGSKTEVIDMLEPEPLVNESTVAEETVQAGRAVTITAAASGGTGVYTYSAYYRADTSADWICIQNGSANTNIGVTLTQPGGYQFDVRVKDTMGFVSRKYFSVAIEPSVPLTNTSSVESTTFIIGDTIIVNGSAEGGFTSYLYGLDYKYAGETEWTPVITFNSNPELAYVPNKTGSCSLRVNVRDAKKTVVRKYINVRIDPKPLVNTTVLPSDKVTVGETIVINGTAEGGAGDYLFGLEYKYTSDTAWQPCQDVSEDSELCFAPTEVGSYVLRITARDSTNKNAYVYLKLTSSPLPLKNLSALATGQAKVNEPLVVNGNAEGGYGSYRFSMEYKYNGESSWTSVCAWSDDTQMEFTPTTAGAISLRVNVIDAKNNIVRKYINFNIEPEPLVNTTQLTSDTAIVGSNLIINGSAEGGYGSYKFGLDYKYSGDTAWQTGQAYSTDNKLRFTPQASGSYYLRICVRDAKNKTAYSYFKLTVLNS